MLSSPKLNPVLCAACGAVIGFYCLSVWFRSGNIGLYGMCALLFIPVVIVCLCRVLVSFPALGVEKKRPAPADLSPDGETLLPESVRLRLRFVRLTGRYVAAFAAGLVIGVGSGAAAPARLSFGIPDSTVKAVSGVLLEDPRIVSGGRAMALLSLRESAGSGGLRVSAKGELPLFFPEESAPRLREFGRGSAIFAEGTLRESRNRSGTGQGPSWFFSAGSMHVVKPAPVLERFRTGLRLGLIRRFAAGSAGSAAAERSEASWGGLALSGMHLAVLAGIIALLLKKPLGLKAAAVAGVLIIILYCFIVGPLPSLTRAALMYLLGALAALGALKRDPLSLLGMAFLIQIVIAPAAGFSLSFILSYLALAGILSAGESLNSLFKGKVPACLLQPLSASLGAFLATAAVTAWFFGTLRPAGMVTGLVLVPLTTVFMILALLWLVLDLAFPFLSGLLSLPLSLLYGLMEKTVSLAGRLPGFTVSWPPLVLAISLGLWLFIVWFAYRRRLAKNRLAAFA